MLEAMDNKHSFSPHIDTKSKQIAKKKLNSTMLDRSKSWVEKRRQKIQEMKEQLQKKKLT